MTKNYQTLLLEKKDAVATIFLNRPEVHNAFNEAMIAELTRVFSTLSKDKEIRVIVLTGVGESFCAGADLNWMKKIAGYSRAQNVADAKRLHQMLLSVYRCAKPVIAKVNGPAIGGGAGLVAAVDMAFAVESAVFSFSEVRLGLIPAVISPFVLRKIGEANAREYFLSAERFDAQRAQAMGLIRYAGTKDEVEKKIFEKIQQLKAAAPGAIADCKKLIEEVSSKSLERIATFTATQIANRRASAEGKEGMAAFLEKRTPRWIV